MGEPICEVYAKMADLGGALGVVNINQLDGCWEHQVDDKWRIAWNGHREPVKNSAGHEVPGYHIYVEYNGWPAGLIHPYGGILAAGEGANEKTFLAAIDKALISSRGEPNDRG